MVASSPTVLKRWLAYELRRLRESAGKTRGQTAERLGRTVAQISHIENGRNLPSAGDVELLLAWYGLPERTELFRDLLRQARKGRDWWIGYADAVRPTFELYLGLEASAERIEGFDCVVIPGLCQTAAYAEAAIRGGDPGAPDAEVARRLELRLGRQTVINRAERPLHLWAVLDECMLRRQIGGPAVLREQLHHLLELGERPHIDIQVLPTAAAAYGVDGAFTWLEFPAELGSDPGVVHLETRIRPLYFEDAADILTYRSTLTRLHAQAATPEDSRVLLDQIAKELR